MDNLYLSLSYAIEHFHSCRFFMSVWALSDMNGVPKRKVALRNSSVPVVAHEHKDT